MHFNGKDLKLARQSRIENIIKRKLIRKTRNNRKTNCNNLNYIFCELIGFRWDFVDFLFVVLWLEQTIFLQLLSGNTERKVWIPIRATHFWWDWEWSINVIAKFRFVWAEKKIKFALELFLNFVHITTKNKREYFV